MDQQHFSRRDRLAAIGESLDQSDLIEKIRGHIQAQFPDAPQSLVHHAVYHLAVEGIDACIVWLSEVAKLYADSAYKPSDSRAAAMIYHLSAWRQTSQVLDAANEEVLALVENAQEYLADGEYAAAKATIDDLHKLLLAKD